jgi:hypothetical protein
MPKRRLKTASDVRRFLAYLINGTMQGKVEPSLSGKAGYLCSILIKCIETSDIEQRLIEIEQKLSNK